jgi:hypothetical protein
VVVTIEIRPCSTNSIFVPSEAPKCRPAVLPAHTQVTSPRNWRNRRKYGIRFILSCDNGYTSTQRGTLVCDPPGWRLEPSSFECSRKWPTPKNVPNNCLMAFLFQIANVNQHFLCWHASNFGFTAKVERSSIIKDLLARLINTLIKFNYM